MLKAMEMYLTPHVQAELEQFTTDTGCRADTLVNDLLSGYFDEQTKVRQTLGSRYDDIKSGRVAPLDGPTVFRQILAENNSRRAQPL